MLMKLSSDFGSQKWVQDTRNGDQPLFLLRPRGQPRISCYPELSGQSSEQAVKASQVPWLHTHPVHHILIRINSGSIFQSADVCCRPYVDTADLRLRKIKYFTVGGFAIKLRAHEGGWGHSDPSSRHLKYFKTGADNSSPPIYLRSFLLGIFIEISARCQDSELWFQSVQLTLKWAEWPVMKWAMGGFSELELSLWFTI